MMDPTTSVQSEVKSGPASRSLHLTGYLAATAAVAVVLILGALLGPGPFRGPGTDNGAAIGESKDGPFDLMIRSPKAAYEQNEPIQITGSLMYNGPQTAVGIAHALGADEGPLVFSIDEPVLGDLRLATVVPQPCLHSELRRDVPLAASFAKGGVWDGDDPQASAYLAYVQDPVLRLPPGTWHARVTASFSVGDCSSNDRHEMNATVTIVVSDETGRVPPAVSPTPTIAPADVPIGDDTQEGPIQLTLTSPHRQYGAGEPIEVIARLGYWGDRPSVTTYGSSSFGPVAFWLRQLEGDVLLGPGGTADCLEQVMLRQNEPIELPFSKSGLGLSDADGEFWQAWRSDPVLRLPAGTWEISAMTEFSFAMDCSVAGPTLRPSITIVVTP